MSKIVSISLLVLILFTGIRINVASHYCHGKLIGSMVSFSGKTPGCGMEEDERTSPPYETLRTHCCENTVRSVTVNPNYVQVSKMILNDSVQKLLFAIVPVNISSNEIFKAELSAGSLRPPGWNYCSGVENPVICVFRI